MRLSILLSLLISGNLSLCAETRWSATEQEGRLILQFNKDSDDTSPSSPSELKQFLVGLHPETPVKHVCFWNYFNHDSVIQTELLKVFQDDHPAVLNEALISSGNMHNPKVIPLRRHFSAALKKTQTIRSIDEIFRGQGYVISDISFEKFWIDKSYETPKFHSIIWLVISPKTEQGGGGKELPSASLRLSPTSP